MEEVMQTMARKSVDMKVIRAFCANGIPFNVLRNPQFHEIVTAINNRPKGYKAPGYERGRTTLLDACKTGVTKSGKEIVDYLLKAIEQVGGINVIQVVTDNAKNCVAAGQEIRKVHKHIFWSPCVVHTLNLIFKENFDLLLDKIGCMLLSQSKFSARSLKLRFNV
ncbi:hypothetical protein ACFX1R_042019 [Malus domestica]